MKHAMRGVLGTSAFVLSVMLALRAPQTIDRRSPDPHGEGSARETDQDGLRAGFPGEAMRWYLEQRMVPAGAIPASWRKEALEHIDRHNRPEPGQSISALSWISVGPSNIGGRVRSIGIVPGNPSVIYAGSVSGGIFKSTTAGATWFPVADFAANLAVTSIVINPANTNELYASTGEGFFNIDAVRGAGVLKSTDAGATWALQTGFTGGSGGFPYYINDLYLRPDSTQRIYAATNNGLFRTTNGGTSWIFLHQGTSTRATQVVEHPTDPRTFFVCYGNFSTDGIYKTTNGGAAFTKLTTGLPSSGYNRISMAVAPSNGQVLYACFNSTGNATRGIFRSTNGGSSWDSVATPYDALSGATHLGAQGWYNNVLAVHPSDPNTVYAGGINLFKSTNGGASWTMISNWYTGTAYPYVHADQHELVFTGTTLTIGNDGGIFRTTDGGTSFTELNSGFVTAQFYSGAVHPSLDVYYGGTQDNGTLKSGTLPAWSMVFGGDGGHTAVDAATPTTVYTEYVYLNFQKSTNSGSTWSKSMNGIPSGPGQFDGTTDRCQFIAPVTLDPSNSQRLAAGTYRLFLTTNGGVLWTAISSDLTGNGSGGSGSTISAVAFAPSSSPVLYIGTSGTGASARIQVTTNTGASWTNVTAPPLPNRYVTRIVVDPVDAGRAWALYSGYDANTPSTPGHVFLTTNGGASWSNRSGNLPDIPVNAGVINPANANHVVVGTDLGIFESLNGGATWTQQNSGMANVQVADLDLRASDRILFAATHGRGMFKSGGPLTTIRGEDAPMPERFALLQNYPNPFNPATIIPFVIPERAVVTLVIYDVTGRRVATLVEGMLEAGRHEVRFSAGDRAAGMYLCELRAGSSVSTRRLLLLK